MKTFIGKIPGLSVVLILVISLVGVAGAQSSLGPDIIPSDANCVHITDLSAEQWLCERPWAVTTTTTLATTTTTEETTTTTEQETTTTVPETTTTTAPTTTTTTSPPSTGLIIPETLPYPGGLKENDGFQFMIGCANEVVRKVVVFECEPNADGKFEHAVFTYMGHGMPYLNPHGELGMHNHMWWEDGDREGYRCGYAFAYDEHPNPFGMFAEDRPAEFTHRATIVRPFDAGYGKLNDRFMDEGQRYYDGTPFTGGTNEIQDEDCQEVALDDFDYENYEPQGPMDIRVGLFVDDWIGDIRDFTDILVAFNENGQMGHFEFVSAGFNSDKGVYRVTIVFVLAQNDKVSHVFYYDILSPNAQIGVEVNGAMVAP